MRRLIPIVALLGLIACATPPPRRVAPEVALPMLSLAPAAFGASVSLAQRLSFAHDADPGGPRSLEALVEIDAAALQLAGFALGQRVFTMQWDGAKLDEQRDARVPEQFQSRTVLRDIQYVYWPAASVRAALPPDWTLEDAPGLRVLRHAGKDWLTVRYGGEPRWAGRAELVNLAEHYRLTIESRLSED
ncbi:DUF3261 domain-containing protein [Myxococcus qinghaiensis]|uniref:DUF3261 domain-containing protein n=1 Tax=Myxococcus qinghaiensis TaxID=2906758 RepID=UPI0020A7A31F|nr:DUF3261 domain-containing protein [Myxococcus qinghaiensis]MCP3161478.1 DUF3261 domain-containing protein [Myxococcus qinghaiensis]